MSEKLARFNHHPDPACDFCEEVEHLESIAESWRLGLTGFGHEADRLTLDDRIERALGFRVGGDLGAIKAKQSLRELAVMRGFDMSGEQAYEGQPIPRDPNRVQMRPIIYAVTLGTPHD